MTRNELLAIVAALAGFVLFCFIISGCSGRLNQEDTERMQSCVEAGGSWDGGHDDCYLPGAPMMD